MLIGDTLPFLKVYIEEVDHALRTPPVKASPNPLMAGVNSSSKILYKRLDKSNPLEYSIRMITIVELPEFIRRAKKLLSETERERLIGYLAAHPDEGNLLEGTGGIRKIRWKREGMGKRGGVRVIYYYHNEQYPVFLLTVFGKSEQANVSKAERNELAQLARYLREQYDQTP